VNTFNSFIENELNEAQRKAVLQASGSILVIAGAGSGKTRVITARIAHLLLNHNTNPRSLIALTFTNKAAQEMKHRLASFLGTDKGLPFIGTFHSYCLYLLRTNPHLAPYPNFTILDDDDQVSILRKFIKNNGLEKQLSPRTALSQISAIKNSSTSEHAKTSLILELYNAYEQEKKKSNSLDFDDLLLEVLNLFKSNSEFTANFQNSMAHILIDEYQDTNHVQHDLLKCMALGVDNKVRATSLCAVGDEDQSIYSWRGAVVENIRKFQEDFGPVTKIKIEQNYRSVEPILKAANSVISHNKNRNEKVLWSSKQASERIMQLKCKSEYQEAEALATLIENAQSKIPLQEMAILYRTHYQSRPLEEALIKASIPYRIIGGLQFYQRKEIKDILAYMRLVVNGHDRVSFYRILNTPTRGFGEKFEELVSEHWHDKPQATFREILSDMLTLNIVDGASKRGKALLDFLAIFSSLSSAEKPSTVFDAIVKQTDYYSYLHDSCEPAEYEVKRDNARELRNALAHYEEAPSDKAERTVEDFLHEVALLQEKLDAAKEDNNCVKLMTLHGAKGLEFDLVMIAGLEEGIFPSSRSIVATESLEEERRLFYVGITRAKEYLLISHARIRNSYGQTSEQTESRFMREIPASLMKVAQLSHMSSFELKSLFQEWLELRKAPKNIMLFNTIKQAKEKAASVSAPITTLKETKKLAGGWSKNRTVLHGTFGSGVIKEVEKKTNETYIVTVQFKGGTKKLLSTFLTLL
jgi:DNA helicase-2/ATP-dependent DNA helicase PcrA